MIFYRSAELFINDLRPTVRNKTNVLKETRIVIETARSMIHYENLSVKFWGEAVNNVVYALNRSGSSLTKENTPYEV